MKIHLFLAVLLLTGCGRSRHDSIGFPQQANRVSPQSSEVGLRADHLDRVGDVPRSENGGTYNIHCIDKNLCWLQDSRTLWKSSDQGATWQFVYSAEKGQEPHTFEFVSPTVGWRISASALYKSSDGGYTWTRKVTPLDSLNGELRSLYFMSDGNLGWLAGGIYRQQNSDELRLGVPNNLKDVTGKKILEEAIFQTDDGGESWRRQSVRPRGPGRSLTIKFMDQYRGLATGELNAYQTDDGGGHWALIKFNKACVRKEYLSDYYDARPEAVAMLNSGLMWISYSDGRIIKSRDWGRSWCDLSQPRQVSFEGTGRQFFTNIEFVDPENGGALGSDKFLYQTKDGGSSWSRVTSDIRFDSMYLTKQGYILLVSDAGVFIMKW